MSSFCDPTVGDVHEVDTGDPSESEGQRDRAATLERPGILYAGAPAGVPRIEDGVQQRAWLCGPPELIVKELKAYEEEYPGLEHFMIHWPEGLTVERFKEQLSIFASEVMPHFGKAKTGHIDLQDHGDEVAFRNIKLRKLKGA